MNRVLAGWFVSCLLAAPAVAQEADKAPQAEIQKLIEQLGDPSYKVRKEAEQALRAKSDAARTILQQTAESHADPEVRWRAQRLLEQGNQGKDDTGGLRRRQAGEEWPAPRGGGAPPGFGPGLQDQFDEMFRRLERDFGVDVPRQRFFGNEFFQDLQQQMQDMREQMRKGAFELGPGIGHSVQIQTGPDGVRVKISERNEAGEVEEKVYEADDMESFREKYPEVAERHFGGPFRGPLAAPRLPVQPLPPGAWHVQPAPQPAQPNDDGPKLGVYVREVAADVAEFLGLESGQGLVVQEIVADGLAQRLGIEAGDIVLEVGGKTVFGIGDVSAGLRDAGDKVTVKVNRRGRELTLEGKHEARPETKGELRKREPNSKPVIR
jgi:hypothetical protein